MRWMWIHTQGVCGEALRVRACPLTPREGAHAGSHCRQLDTRRGLMPHIDEACRLHTHDVVQHTPATQRGPARSLPATRKLTDTNVFGKNQLFRWLLSHCHCHVYGVRCALANC